jgi:DNA-binding transcriptional LysR family regulator
MIHAERGMFHMPIRERGEIDFRDLRVLDALIREGSITGAAQALETTQPAISKLLRRLRARFDDPLVVRRGRGVQPTTRAVEMSAQIRKLLEMADGLQQQRLPFDPEKSEKTFSLLLTDVGMVRFLPPLVARLADLAPNIKVRALPLDSRHFALKLESGEADIALGAFPGAAGHLRFQRLYSDGYASVVRRGHPRAKVARSRRGFVGEQHILITASETGHAAHLETQRVLTRAIAPSNILLQVPSFIAGAIVASQTDGVATLPANLAALVATPLGMSVFRPPVSLPRIEIAQYWHERSHRDPAHRWLRSITLGLFGDRGQVSNAGRP